MQACTQIAAWREHAPGERMLAAGAFALIGALSLALPASAQEDSRIEQLQCQIEELQRQLDELRSEVENRLPPPLERPRGASAAGRVRQRQDQAHDLRAAQPRRPGLRRRRADQVLLRRQRQLVEPPTLEGSGRLNDELGAGAVLEVELQSNSTREVSQDNESTGTARFEDRKAEVYVDSTRLGRVWLGQGSSASDHSAEVDLLGTGVVGTSDIADFAGGLQFVDDGELSGVTIHDTYDNFDGLGRDDRIRYDSPRFGGFGLAASAGADSNFDLAGTFSGALDRTQLAGAAAFASDGGDFRQLDGSASLLLASGCNVTAAAGWRDFDAGDRDDGRYVYGKLGYRFDPFPIGATALALDAYYGEDVGANGDKAFETGGFAVQDVDAIATELYFGYRYHHLSRNDADFDPINAVLSGARVRF